MLFDLRVCFYFLVYFMVSCDCYSRTSSSKENRVFLDNITEHIYTSLLLDTLPIPLTTSSIKLLKTTRRPKLITNTTLKKKEYEVISLVFRKTKLYIDADNESTTQNAGNRSINVFRIHTKPVSKLYATKYKTHTSTASKIEFYYWNEEEHAAKKTCSRCKFITKNKFNVETSRGSNNSFLMFHVKGLSKTTKTTKLFIKHRNNGRTRTTKPFTLTFKSTNRRNKNKIGTKFNNFQYAESLSNSDDERDPQESTAVPFLTATEASTIDVTTTEKQGTKSTENDKINFFEQYDQNTPTTFYSDYVENVEAYNFRRKSKIYLKNVDHDTGHEHDLSKLSKKHVNESKYSKNGVSKYMSFINTTPYENVTQSNVSLKNVMDTGKRLYNSSAPWTDYPFVAVYIYEPSQVHCDAAAINSYWLIASGSCLSRLGNKWTNIGGQSAFVAYCGDHWWHPSRVTYVKYTLVHPSFHPTDVTRKHLYNIGVIQVVTSMASACFGWSPVTLMSHLYLTDPEGSEASALGWGLDRLNSRYTLDLPKHTLSIYHEKVYSNSCPGNNAYRTAKGLSDGGGVKNVYCLSLPPYTGEGNDPVHGSLLLVGGKLIALYLQEERRPVGPQSAVYTGIWRILPWIIDVAREPEDAEMISF